MLSKKFTQREREFHNYCVNFFVIVLLKKQPKFKYLRVKTDVKSTSFLFLDKNVNILILPDIQGGGH